MNGGVRPGRPYVERRVFLATAAGGVLLAARAATAAAGSGRVFVDPRLEALPRRPWRKVHLDYHNTEHLPRLAQDFDEDAPETVSAIRSTERSWSSSRPKSL